MYARCISSKVHPATWAIIGVKRDALGITIAPLGTGFAVDRSGHILTCWHVTYMDRDQQIECDEFLVTQPGLGPARYKADTVTKDKDRDVALLRIDGNVRTKPVTLLDRNVPFGSSCCAFGHPLSSTDPTTKSMRIYTRAAAGLVSMPIRAATFPGTRPVRLYELDFFTYGGSSGGPVFLPNGDTFAWVRASLLLDDGSGKKKRSNLTVTVDIREAIEFLKPLKINLKIRRGLWR